ncbi:TNT domain-containing protein [Saccharothrix sp. NPDC042600]|uniref:TNT domain-containing protein n=1 Tax=Saccharothrix TaxID=2071 RepID=UPI0033F5E61E|nr:hypothetical protein GCM10017745_14710 [Saccharothrix mutabilis subsp. capreolus]
MGIELPAELAEVAAKAGVTWPQADEDALRSSAGAWREAGTRLSALAGESDGAASRALAGLTGETGDAARRHWTKFTGPDGKLDEAVRGCNAAADRLDHAAQQVGAAKVELVRELVNLAKNNDAANQAAAAGHPTALLGLDTAVRGAAANVAHLTDTLTSAVRLDSGVQIGGRPLVDVNPGVHGPAPTGPGDGAAVPGNGPADGRAPGTSGGAPGGAPGGLLGGGLLGGGLLGGQPGQGGLLGGILDGGQNQAQQPVAPGQAQPGQGQPGQAQPGAGQGGGLLGRVVETVAAPVAAVVDPVLDTTGKVVHGAVEVVGDTTQGVTDTVGRTVQGAADVLPGGPPGHDGPQGRPDAPGRPQVVPGLVEQVASPVLGGGPAQPVVETVGRTADTVTQSAAAVLERPLLPTETPHAPAQPTGPTPNTPQGPGVGGPGGGGLGGPGGGLGGGGLGGGGLGGGGVGGGVSAPAAGAAASGAAAGAAATQAPAAGQAQSQAQNQAQSQAAQQAARAGQPTATGPTTGSPTTGTPTTGGPSAGSPTAGGSAGAAQTGQGAGQGQTAAQNQGGQSTQSGQNQSSQNQSGQNQGGQNQSGQPKDGVAPKDPAKDAAKAAEQAAYGLAVLPLARDLLVRGGQAQAFLPGWVPGQAATGGPAHGYVGTGPAAGGVSFGSMSGVLGTGPAVSVELPGAPQRAAQTAEPGDESVALFLLHMFPGGTLPPARRTPARQLPTPSEEQEFASGLRFEPQGHPDGDLVDASARPLPRFAHGPAAEPDPALLDGYDPLAGMHERDWDRRFLVRADPPEYAWPPGELFPEGGYEAGQPGVLAVGVELDRFGTPEGRVLSELGTPFAERSLPPAALDAGYHRYRVVRELPVWFTLSAEWFGQRGGGVRYRTTHAVAELVAFGYLEEVR